MVNKNQLPLVQIGKNQLKTDLKRMGILEGDHVSVALSLKSIGFVVGGPDTLIDAILEVVGPKGTLIMNTHTKVFPISEINPNFIFDHRSTVPHTGIVPQCLMKRKGSIRSKHPIFSVVAIGRYAKYLTDNHDEHSTPYLPLEKLGKIEGKTLFIGTNGRLVAIRHEAQRKAGLSIVPMHLGVLYQNDRGKINLYAIDHPGCATRLPELVPKLEKMQTVKLGKVGMAPAIIGSADGIIGDMSSMLKNDPTLSLCHDPLCVYCRELERRLDLYDKVKNPIYFQRSKLLIQLLCFRNKIILLRKYNRVSFCNPRMKRKFQPVSFTATILLRISLILSHASKYKR